MRLFKKLMVVFVAVMMVMSLTSRVCAEEENKITINDDRPGYTYNALQIFSGDVSETEDNTVILSNISWGANINSGAFLTAIQNDDTFKTGDPATNIFASAETATDVAKALSDNNVIDNSEMAKRFALLAGKNTTGDGTPLVWDATEKTYSAAVAPGYYLIKNTAVPAQEGQDNTGAYTEFIMEVIGDVEASPKRSDVTIDKKVGEKNDSEDTGAIVVDDLFADHDIGDDVPFKLTATTATNVHAYKKYHLEFVDTQSGFEAPTAFKVKVGNNEPIEINSDNSWKDSIVDDANKVKITVEGSDVAAAGFKVKVTFEDTVTGELQIGSDAYDNATVIVDYTAKLSETAVIGNPGNPNTVELILVTILIVKMIKMKAKHLKRQLLFSLTK